MREKLHKIGQFLSTGNLEEAKRNFQDLSEDERKYPATKALEGIYSAQKGDLGQALGAFAVASEKMPHNAALYCNMASALRGLNRLKSAEEAVKKSLRINKLNNPLAWYEYAQIQTAQEMHNEAVLTLYKCIEHSPLFFPAYAALTQYLLLDNQIELAIKLYKTASEGAPDEQFFKDRLQELQGQ